MPNHKLRKLKDWIKNELIRVEDEMMPLEDLNMQKKKWGRHQNLRAYHHIYTKILKQIRQIEYKNGDKD